MLAPFATTRKWWMPSNVQWRKQNEYYTGHKILQILTVIGRLCALYVIGSLLAQRWFTNLQMPRFLNTAIDTYESYHGQILKPEVRKLYQVNVDCLKDMLLSLWSRKNRDGYATCACCYKGMCPNLANKRTSPKFAITNGLVISSFLQEIEFTNKDGKRKARNIKDNELTYLLKAMLAPVRQYGCVFAYSGGSQKWIKENYHFLRWTKTGSEQSLTIWIKQVLVSIFIVFFVIEWLLSKSKWCAGEP